MAHVAERHLNADSCDEIVVVEQIACEDTHPVVKFLYAVIEFFVCTCSSLIYVNILNEIIIA